MRSLSFDCFLAARAFSLRPIPRVCTTVATVRRDFSRKQFILARVTGCAGYRSVRDVDTARLDRLDNLWLQTV